MTWNHPLKTSKSVLQPFSISHQAFRSKKDSKGLKTSGWVFWGSVQSWNQSDSRFHTVKKDLTTLGHIQRMFAGIDNLEHSLLPCDWLCQTKLRVKILPFFSKTSTNIVGIFDLISKKPLFTCYFVVEETAW